MTDNDVTAQATKKRQRASRATRYLRAAMLTIALALPLISLVVLGSVWLWQNGFVLYWAVGALIVTSIAFAIERWLLRDAVAEAKSAPVEPLLPPEIVEEREIAAWKAVLRLADDTAPGTIDSRDSLLDLGKKTVEVVARQMHPGDKDPLLKFTVPELLALIGRVSGELAPFVRETIPLGDRLTVAQFLAIYRWRGVIDVADKAYDLWRIVRLLNPATAMAQELREKFTRQLYDWGRDELARKLTSAYIKDVGRAAIDLYSGRMRDSVVLLPDQRRTTPDVSAAATASSGVVADAKKARKPGALRRLWTQTRNAGKLLISRNKDENLR